MRLRPKGARRKWSAMIHVGCASDPAGLATATSKVIALRVYKETHMYAIVKTGGKQYKVAPGDKLNVEKLDAEVGSKVELTAICIVDGDKVEADPAKAAATKVTATVIEQFRGEKQLVFKFKKRKNYKKMRGHRQYLTRIQVESIG